MKILKLKYFVLPIIILMGFSSCVEKEEMTETDYFMKKMSDGKATVEDLDKLIESFDGVGETIITPPDGKFKLTFPVSNVKNETVKLLEDGMPRENHTYSANMQGKDHPNLAYQVAYTFMPEVKTERQINQLFDGQRDYLISGTNAKVEFEKLIESNGTPGRHLYMTIDDSNMKTNTKMFFKNGIFYQLTVATEDGHLFNNQISEFFGSFEMLD